MRFGTLILLSALGLGSALPAVAYNHARRGPTSPRLFRKNSVKPKAIGQRAIDEQRATQIQAALVKVGYLTGVPSGHWDDATQAAMAKLQADNGWQTKLVPDSRAIIKLGLGPAEDNVDALVSGAGASPVSAGSSSSFGQQ